MSICFHILWVLIKIGSILIKILTSKHQFRLIPIKTWLKLIFGKWDQCSVRCVFSLFDLKNLPWTAFSSGEKGRSSFFRWTIHSVKCIVNQFNLAPLFRQLHPETRRPARPELFSTTSWRGSTLWPTRRISRKPFVRRRKSAKGEADVPSQHFLAFLLPSPHNEPHTSGPALFGWKAAMPDAEMAKSVLEVWSIE